MQLPPILTIALVLTGAFALGLLVGWITSSVFRRAKRNRLTDIGTVIGIICGGAAVHLVDQNAGTLGIYFIGLVVGFFGYIFTATRPGATPWLGSGPSSATFPANPEKLPETAPQKK